MKFIFSFRHYNSVKKRDESQYLLERGLEEENFKTLKQLLKLTVHRKKELCANFLMKPLPAPEQLKASGQQSHDCADKSPFNLIPKFITLPGNPAKCPRLIYLQSHSLRLLFHTFLL